MQWSSVFSIFASLVVVFHEGAAMLLDPQCGYTGMVGKVVGGLDAVAGENPWMAYLYQNKNQFICGGSLPTASSMGRLCKCCLRPASPISMNLTMATFLRRVRLGELYSQNQAGTALSFGVMQAFRNRRYKKADHVHDIGMLHLDRSVEYNAYIRPVCILTDPSLMPYASFYRTTGWGRTETERVAKVLQTIELYDLDPSKCQEQFMLAPNEGQICAGNPRGDTCVGDSGGPLVQQVAVGDEWRFFQFGITSYGHPECHSPGVYTRVASYVDWVQTVVNRYAN
ncbi:hypothetical protein KR018_012534 [Drosophila ironensis]|nr:hypothetical protein KR018_012534 [Drosophila ironensis]